MVLKVYKRLKGKIGNLIKFLIIYIKYSNKLKRLKNIHNGERCFIIGNGPSLRMEDLDKLKNEYTFAANKIYIAFEDTAWRPTYYCVQDSKIINNELETLTKKVEAKIKFIAGNFLVFKNIFLYNWIYFCRGKGRFFSQKPKFSENIQRLIYPGYTVTYTNIQLAVYMGFNEIYLLGVDHNYSVVENLDGTIAKTDIKNHFSDKYDGKNNWYDLIINKQVNIPRIEEMTLTYQAAKEYADAHGIKIYNATRGGKLEVFDRFDFDSLFN